MADREKHTWNTNPVVLFDGVCNLCNASVVFMLRRDRKKLLRFAALQSQTGQQLLKDHSFPSEDRKSVILIENGRWYTRSTAVLRICRYLKQPWPLFYSLVIIPPFLRNSVYRIVAFNRYQWFGRKDKCMIPSKQWEHRFL